jgi:hypothetical protein
VHQLVAAPSNGFSRLRESNHDRREFGAPVAIM